MKLDIPAIALSIGSLLTASIATAAIPAPFIENAGQAADNVRYYARLSSGTLFVTTDSRLVYSIRSGSTDQARWSFRESFRGGTLSVPNGAAPSPIRITSFKGDPDSWRTLRSWDRVDLGEIYPGIRVSLKAGGHNVEKLLYLAPGADVSAVAIAVDGVDGMALDHRDRLVLQTGLGDIAFTAPVAWQTVDGRRRTVDVR